ncbi:hypothetical protein ACFRCI_03545 [Streptomyces sp. NPDC056638]|uniref:hypothetical protein n=1 Tax=Streptomyces sp. NPDC056638 TaxID=3345887 RepID=UPI003697004C
MKTLAVSWYESSSFWQFAITTIVALAVGALGAYATLRSSHPKRRLTYRTLANTSLFPDTQFTGGGASVLRVTHGTTPVNRPRLVEVDIRNTGRRDITSAMFHNGDPIQFDLGVGIVAILGVAATPTTSMVPPVVLGPSTQTILIDPCLIARKQAVVISALVDGDEAPVACSGNPLVDVDVVAGGEMAALRVSAAVTVADQIFGLTPLSPLRAFLRR